MTVQVETPMTGADLVSEAEASLMFVTPRPPAVIVRGRGSYLWDSDGKRYLDFVQGWAVNCLGHCPPVLARALSRQARELVNASPAFYNDRMIGLARLLTEHSCLDKVFFANSGADANEGAVKLARKYGALRRGGAHEVITTWNGFLGRTLAMMSASGKKQWDGLFEPKAGGFVRVPFNDLAAMREALGRGRACAVMLEPIQGEAGVVVAERAYLEGVRKLCDEHGALLILDEIQTGIGRTGTLFAYEQYGIEPDIMTLGKGLGGGFPMAALLAKDAVCVFETGDQGGTFCAQPLAMAAGHAVVSEVIARRLPARAATRGRYLARRLRALPRELGLRNVRGKGLLLAVDLPTDTASDVVTGCLEAGLLVNAPRPATLRFMPALTVSRAEIDEMLSILHPVLTRVLTK